MFKKNEHPSHDPCRMEPEGVTVFVVSDPNSRPWPAGPADSDNKLAKLVYSLTAYAPPTSSFKPLRATVTVTVTV